MSHDSDPAPARLTVAENLIWLGQRLLPESPLYNMGHIFELPAGLDIDNFAEAFRHVVVDFDALRTVVIESKGDPVRVVQTDHEPCLDWLDFSDSTDSAAEARTWVELQIKKAFDLESRLYHAALLKTGSGQYSFYFNQHHIVTDALSASNILHRLSRWYELLVAENDDLLPAMPSYSEYVRFEHGLATDTTVADAKRFWTRRMEREPDAVHPYGLRPLQPQTDSVRIWRRLGKERSEAIRTLAAGEARMLTDHLAVFSIFATLLTAFLHRISGSSDVTIGAPVHKRSTPAFRDIAGLMIELFPLRTQIEGGDTFETLLRRVQAEVLDFLRHAQPGASDAGLHTHFNVVLNYITATFPEIGGQPMRSDWLHPGEIDAGHALRLHVRDVDQTGIFDLAFDFNTAVFTDRLISLAVDHYVEVIDDFLADRTTPLSRVLSHRFDVTPTSLLEQRTETVLTRFESRVDESADAIAITEQDRSISYSDLDSRANQIANHLLETGLQVDQPVALQLPRSGDFVAAVIGVLKAGGSFCPIPQGSPPGRVRRILDDLGNPIVLSTQNLASCYNASSRKPERSTGSTAYILYTSGSTGRPKGVVVGQEALTNYVSWATETYVGDSRAVWPFFTSTGFDLTLTSLFVPLVSGGSIVIYPEIEGETDTAVVDVFTENRVDIVKLTPSHLEAIRDLDLNESRVRLLVVGGERLQRGLAVRTLGDLKGPLDIYNEYGPTEATIGCVVHRFQPNVDTSESVPIGLPIPGAVARVLDGSMHDVPIGAVGQLYIGGVCLADGYRDSSDPSSAAFADHPDTSERLYATGDLVRILPDGCLEYLRRTDDQVKIRGHRIETLEIETTLARLPSISSAAVVALARPEPQTTESIRRCLNCGLPSNVPGTQFDSEGLCNLCSDFTTYSAQVSDYWSDLDELESILKSQHRREESGHDCILLFSGGKDSTYALSRLVEMGLRVLAFTLDNGFISDQAKANIRRVTGKLGVDLVFGSTPAMNAIFVDSLNRHANVCNGCFKAIYTLGLKTALERNIPFIVTGLSRGQLFETRLTGELFSDQTADADMIDLTVLEARKAYHRIDDTVNRLLDTDWLEEDAFEKVKFVDFYRYCDVELDEVYAYLRDRVPWLRPEDTGRSTNCLINDLGIYVHKRKRGFHNYAYPYSWDVRLGHKKRDDALAELDDEIDESRTDRMMREIGFTLDDSEVSLVAYVVTGEGSLPDLRAALGEYLPQQMIPARFIEVPRLPLSPNGKVDRSRLVELSSTDVSPASDYAGPRNEVEEELCSAWEKELGTRIGIHDNFFSLGGDSLRAILIASNMNRAGYRLKPTDFFRHPTVAGLSTQIKVVQESATSRPDEQVTEEGSRFGLDERSMSQLETALGKIDGNGKR